MFRYIVVLIITKYISQKVLDLLLSLVTQEIVRNCQFYNFIFYLYY